MPVGWIAAAGAIGGALIGANATGNAADTQAGATQAGIDEQRRQADRAYADQQIYRDAGGRALSLLESELGRSPTAAEVMSRPGYQFGLQQGQLGLDRKIAAGGGRISGRALKAASAFNTDYATTGYAAEDQRRENRLARLQTLAGLGQSATASSGALGANSSNAISGMLTAQGNATGASQIAQGNIWGNATNQLASLYGRNSGGGYVGSSAGYNGNYNASPYSEYGQRVTNMGPN